LSSPDLRHLSFRVPDPLLREVEAIAAERGTLSQVVREALAQYVERMRRARRRQQGSAS
jgi:metal-responsive CopG/Arc/MetJ family transcriptional regulator